MSSGMTWDNKAEGGQRETWGYKCCDCYECTHERFLSNLHNPRHEISECDHMICNTSDSVFADTDF